MSAQQLLQVVARDESVHLPLAESQGARGVRDAAIVLLEGARGGTLFEGCFLLAKRFHRSSTPGPLMRPT